jgi:hypothetical protein
MPNLTIGLDPRLKALLQQSVDLDEIQGQSSGPAESPRPAESAHARAQWRRGSIGTTTELLCSVNRGMTLVSVVFSANKWS